MSLPSPLTSRARSSAKLAALHARLSLSENVSVHTLARTLVDQSADPNPEFNNANLASVGEAIIHYHIVEWLMCRYPRLPTVIMMAALKAYAGPQSLLEVAQSWGVESAAAPGGEVNPGLLQFDVAKIREPGTKFGSKRVEADYLEKFKWRRGINSRVVFDDDFGDVVNENAENSTEVEDHMAYGTQDTRASAGLAYTNFVRAVVGAIYVHSGREAAHSFVKGHIMSRTVDPSKLFSFKAPTRELAMLCAREDFEPPVARLLSETGRLSRTPVFVVGIYSGNDKLGEGTGPSLDHARWKAAMNSLMAWYLYSPGENVRVPSDMLAKDAKPWKPVYVDIGEIVAR